MSPRGVSARHDDAEDAQRLGFTACFPSLHFSKNKAKARRVLRGARRARERVTARLCLLPGSGVHLDPVILVEGWRWAKMLRT